MRALFKAILAVSAIFFMALSCSKSSDTSDLQKQIDELKSVQIASINTQITNIKTSLGNLEAVDGELRSMINDIKGSVESIDDDIDELIQNLESIDAALNLRIDQLKAYCDNQDNIVKSWASMTFATLEQHSAVLTEIANIKTQLSGLSQSISTLDTSLSQKISDAEASLLSKISDTEDSVKSWVNEQLTGYYTIAQVDAKVKALEDAYKAADQTITGEISSLTQALNKAKTDLTAAYQAAITTAITENNGTINQKIADDIKTATDTLQAKIDTINGRLDAIESRLDALEAQVAELIEMVQSIVVVPDYSDGSVKLTNTENNVIRFEVYPLEAAAAIAEKGPSILSLDYIQTITKSSSELQNLPITAVAFDNDMLLLTVDGTNIPFEILQGTISANARLNISDGTNTRTSEYFPIYTPSHDYVNLGLSVLWARCNLGADSPEEYGDYFAWGETNQKSYYDTNNYKWYNTAYAKTKYNTRIQFGSIFDNRTVLEAADDAAAKVLGGNWRMPTDEEWIELCENCTWIWTALKGVHGYKVISNKIGYTNNSIFLPAVGYQEWNCDYWSSSLDTLNPELALGVRFLSSDGMDNIYPSTTSLLRCYGYSVRPVLGLEPIESITLKDCTLKLNQTPALDVTILPANASIKALRWISSDESTALVDYTGKVRPISAGTVTIKAEAQDGNGSSATCAVTVEPYSAVAGKAIDLGLSVKWGSINLGANSPEEYGDYFAWGETNPKGYYAWETYKWCDGRYNKLTKYNTRSSSGTVDNRTVLEAADDAASRVLGGNWRMPTDEEWTELRENCTWIWTTLNGVNGYKVISNQIGYTNNSIFLPAAGYRYNTLLDNDDSYGYYWSSSLNTGSLAWYVYFYSGHVFRHYRVDRSHGFSVRPVAE